MSSRAVITAGLTGAAFLTAAFLGSSGRLPPPPSVALALFPPLAGVVAVCWRTRARWVALAGVIGVLAVALVYSSSLAAHVSTVWFVEHVLINLLLAAFFGRTLLPGAEPLVTRIARAMRPSMPQEVVEYTRAVTVAWTIYFVVMAALSVALYLGSSIAVWSAFATFVSGPAVALMFLFEFALRRRRVPESRASIAQSIAGFRALAQAPAAAAGAEARSHLPDWQSALNHAAGPADVWPLIAAANARSERAFAWRDGAPISVAEFLRDVQHVATGLPPISHALNACNDRYLFAVALGACLARGIVTLLPPARTQGVLAHLLGEAPDLVLLVDPNDNEPDDGLPMHRLELGARSMAAPPLPALPGTQLVARVYTSGSTGQPQPQSKYWGPLVRGAAAQLQRLAAVAPPNIALVGTVPPQHAYGFESTVMIALAGGAALTASKPFFPADIAAALETLPRPRGLVTTPFHLRTVLDAGIPLPPLDLLLSATAPLSSALACAAESAFRAPLIEIYGATETGQLATRRSSCGERWMPYADVRVEQIDGQAWAEGGHVQSRTLLADLIETAADGSFALLGRQADMVNIAGKRSSLAYLTQVLLRVPGVVDGAFFLPEDPAGAEITRLAAAVVAPGLGSKALMAALRQHIDPVFLPRPLLLVPTLPRSAVSKLPVAELRALLHAAREPS